VDGSKKMSNGIIDTMKEQAYNAKNPPTTLLNSDGYPTNEYIRFILNYEPDKEMPILRFIEILCTGWQYGATPPRRVYKGIRRFELHTGGWSGNEEIIEVMMKNTWLTQWPMRYVRWEVGGHYYFEIVM